MLNPLNEEKNKVNSLSDQLEEEKNKANSLSDQLEEEKKKVLELNNELKNEKDKNEKLYNDLKFEKDKTSQLTEELNDLKRKLNETKNVNGGGEENRLLNELKEAHDKHKQILNECIREKQTNLNLNEQINKLTSQINSLKLDLNSKNDEITNLRNELNELNRSNNNAPNLECKPGEKIIIAHFIDNEQKVNFPIACKNTDIFVRIEEQLYDEFPEFKEKITYFTVNGVMIKRFKSMDDNHIKNRDKIMINIYNNLIK